MKVKIGLLTQGKINWIGLVESENLRDAAAKFIKDSGLTLVKFTEHYENDNSKPFKITIEISGSCWGLTFYFMKGE